MAEDRSPEEVMAALVARFFASAEATALLYAADVIEIDIDKMDEAQEKISAAIASGQEYTASVMIDKAPDENRLRFVFMGWNDG